MVEAEKADSPPAAASHRDSASESVAGSSFLELVAVMDRLRSPGGCPWDAEQTHQSLTRYLVEETYEVLATIESGDRDHLCEELGDLLLQIVFHARIAQEDTDQPFTIDDVCQAVVAKLIRRHPHVFADANVEDAGGVTAQWNKIKETERAQGLSGPRQKTAAEPDIFHGIPHEMPALARAHKMLDVMDRKLDPQRRDQLLAQAAGDDEATGQLLAAVRTLQQRGTDPEGALRTILHRLAATHPQPQ